MAAPFAARSTKTVERMARERAQASFPVREMTYYLDGGKGMTDIKVSVVLGWFWGDGDWCGGFKVGGEGPATSRPPCMHEPTPPLIPTHN